jgi:hypothetical protein
MISKPTGTVTFLFTGVEGRMKLAREHPGNGGSGTRAVALYCL